MRMCNGEFDRTYKQCCMLHGHNMQTYLWIDDHPPIWAYHPSVDLGKHVGRVNYYRLMGDVIMANIASSLPVS